MKSSFHRFKPLLAILTAAAIAASTMPQANAGTPAKSVQEPEGLRIHGLLQLDVSNAYITPRGLNVENEGVVFQPLLLLFWNLYSNPDGFLNDITLTTGVWNSIHTHESGANPSHWNEIDPIAGLSFKFAKDFTFDVFWSAFHSQTDSYDTSNNLDLKLSYADKWFGNFSLNPYVEFFYELNDKATVVFDFDTSEESWYFQLGLAPTYKFESIPLTVSMPTFVSIVDGDFYQRFDGTPGGSGAGVFSSQLKFSTPLTFVPKSYGNWTAYASFQYYYLFNDGVLDGNQVLATADREEHLYQFHAGISVFF